MVNKRGFLQTLEAVLAILIIFGTITYFSFRSRTIETGVPNVVNFAQQGISRDLSDSREVRECAEQAYVGDCKGDTNVLDYDGTGVEDYEFFWDCYKDFSSHSDCSKVDFVLPYGILGQQDYDEFLRTGNTNIITGQRKCSDVFNSIIKKYVHNGFDYACEICDNALTCTIQNVPAERSVYSESIFIGVSEEEAVGKVIRFYIWRK